MLVVDPTEQKLIEDFQKLYFTGVYPKKERYGGPWVNWRGYSIIKQPSDLMIYQEIIYDTKPDLILETGTRTGGSALFFADMQELNGIKPHVFTIDIEPRGDRPVRDGISYFTGSSLDCSVFVGNNVLVSLDSDHTKGHVLKELDHFCGLLKKGNYMVVEDTSLNGHPVDPDFGPGPFEALEEWLPKNPEFRPDYNRERLLLTSNPCGWLRRQ